MWRQKPSFRFEIDNFSEKEAVISSKTFVSGGCEWFVKVHPKGDSRAVKTHMSLYLYVANPKSLQTGWKRSVQHYFVVLSQSNKELYRSYPKSGQASSLFDSKNLAWGYSNTLPLSKIPEKGLENDKLIIEVYINVLEAVDGEDVSKKNETLEINGFQVLPSQVTSVRKLFTEHPDMAEDFKSNNKAVKTAYMNVLLKLVAKLDKSPEALSETKLTKASNKLSELMNVGFKLGWLKSKLDDISSLKKKFDESRAQKIEERIKNLEVLELESLKTKIDEVTLESKDLKKALDDVLFEKTEENSRADQLEERLKSLEAMELDSKHNSLKDKLKELEEKLDELEMSDDESWAGPLEDLEERITNLETDESWAEPLEGLEERVSKLEDDNDDDGEETWAEPLEELKERVKNLEDVAGDESWGDEIEERVKSLEEMETDSRLKSLKTELDEERKKENSRAQQLEVRLKNLELMETELKFEFLKSTLSEASLEKKKENCRVQGLEDRLKNLELKYEEVSLERKKENYRAQQLEERLKNLELMENSVKLSLEEASLERKKENCQVEGHIKNVEMNLGSNIGSLKTKLEEMEMKLDDDTWTEQLEERVMSLEEMELEYKLDCLNRKHEEVSLMINKADTHYESRLKKLEESMNTKLEEVSVERKKSEIAEESRVEQLEVRFNELELKYGTTCKYFKSKFEDDSLERKKTHDADVSRIQKLEEYLEDNVENLELMVSGLKDALDKKKDKSSADGFMLVD